MRSGPNAPIDLTAVVTVGSRPLNEIRISSWASKLRDLDLEIIFVFDNFDNSILQKEIVDLYSRYGINHKIINVKVQSPGKSREAGMKVAKGNWIVFWDCDDDPHNTNMAIDLCRNSTANVNFLIFKYKARKLSQKGSTKESVIYINESPVNWTKNPGIWRIYFRKSRVVNLAFEDMRMGEDQVFLVKCDMNGSEVSFVNEVAYEYFVGNSGQLTNSNSSKEELKRALLSVEDFLELKQSKVFRYQREIQCNLTKTATKIDFLKIDGLYRRFKFIVNSKQIRHVATLYFIGKLSKNE
jgi:hypothetical protein